MLRRAIQAIVPHTFKIITFATGTAALKITNQHKYKPVNAHKSNSNNPVSIDLHPHVYRSTDDDDYEPSGTNDIFRKILKQPKKETNSALITKKLFSPDIRNVMISEDQEEPAEDILRKQIYQSYKILLMYPAGIRAILADDITMLRIDATSPNGLSAGPR